jgi:hypothetical protein
MGWKLQDTFNYYLKNSGSRPCQHIQFRCRGINQKKENNIQNMVKVYDKECFSTSKYTTPPNMIYFSCSLWT